MDFQLNSVLYANPPEFTLTCTSTGGPATTVSWTRGSTMLCGTSQVLTNAETGTYNNTLRVDMREVGVYTCTVSNSRTSPPAATTLQIAGKEPEISCDFSCIGPFRLLVIAELSIQYFTVTWSHLRTRIS